MYLASLHFKGYRSLVDASLPLQPLSVIIGPNACGKTSIAEALSLLTARAAGDTKRFEQNIIGLGGVNAIRSFIGELPKQITIEAVTDTHLGYELAFANNYAYKLEVKEAVVIQEQHSSFKALHSNSNFIEAWKATLTPTDIVLNPNMPLKIFGEMANAAPDKTRIPDVVGLNELLSNGLFLNRLNTLPNSPIRLPQTLLPELRPGQAGETLFSCLYNLRNTQQLRSIFDEIEEVMRQAFSGFDHFELPVVGAGQITLTWHDDNLSQALYPNQLSDGTLQFLWLITHLICAEPPALLVIDEPELNLHPALLHLLSGLLQDAATRSQIIVLTHASDLIRWLPPEAIVVADKEDGETRFTPATDARFNLGNWLNDFNLSDLWRMGVLGGQP